MKLRESVCSRSRETSETPGHLRILTNPATKILHGVERPVNGRVPVVQKKPTLANIRLTS